MPTRCGYITAHVGGVPQRDCTQTTDDRYCPGHAEAMREQAEDRAQEWREAAESDHHAERDVA